MIQIHDANEDAEVYEVDISIIIPTFNRAEYVMAGIGPIVFRGEEDILEGHSDTLEFYDNVIGSYEGEVEAW
jgi:hypothetical protein